MKHYEIIFMIHPDKSDKSSHIIQEYKDFVTKSKGLIHRLEDWGRRQLAYPIKKLQKAHYVLMNIQVSPDIINELSNNFRFNEFIIRNLIICVKKKVTKTSPMLKKIEEKKR